MKASCAWFPGDGPTKQGIRQNALLQVRPLLRGAAFKRALLWEAGEEDP